MYTYISFFSWFPCFHHYSWFPFFIFMISEECYSSFILMISISSIIIILINDFHYFNAFIIHSHKLYFFFFSSRSCMFILSWFIMKWCFIAAMLNNSNSTSTRPSTGMFHIAINRSDKTLGHLCTCRSRSVHIYFCSNLTIRHHCFLRFIC